MIYCFAIGNPLRGDDGVARHVLQLIAPHPDVHRREVLQLVPEIAAEIATADAVFFIDADVRASQPSLQPIDSPQQTQPALSHHVSPAEVVAHARNLFSFSGRAFLCRIPAIRFEEGETLSPEVERTARHAAKILEAEIKKLGER